MPQKLEHFSDSYVGAHLQLDDARDPSRQEYLEIIEIVHDKVRGSGARYRLRGSAAWENTGVYWDSLVDDNPARYTIWAVSPEWK